MKVYYDADCDINLITGKKIAVVGYPIEETGAKLRAMMPWTKANALIDKTKN